MAQSHWNSPSFPMPKQFSSLPPEVHHIVFSFLDKKSLAHCARVNKSWRATCTPHLWRAVDIRKCNGFENFANGATQLALVQNASSVRHLTACLHHWKYLSVLLPRDNGSVAPRCTYLCSLEVLCAAEIVHTPQLDSAEPQSKNDFMITDGIQALTRMNPKLTTIQVDSGITSHALLRLTKTAQNLRDLNIGARMSISHAKRLLESLPTTIRNVTITLPDCNSISESHVPCGQLLQHHDLETLRINGNFYGQEAYLLLPFLDTCCQTLTCVQCPQAQLFSNNDLSAALAKLSQYLADLTPDDLPGRIASTDDEIAVTILGHPHLKRIDITRCTYAATLTAAAILDTCKDDLEELSVAGCGRISSEDLQAILCSANKLESLVAISQKYTFGAGDPILGASDVVSSIWATTSLKHFECRIVEDLAKEGHSSRNNVSAAPATMTYQAMQRQVFLQLGTQSNLEQLILCRNSEGTSVPPRQRDFLNMTLDSGLGEMAGASRLQALGVEKVANIGIPELSWMAQHWPRLQWQVQFFDGVCPLKRINK
ncbi:hypothetical protein BGZ59_003375 [Podila verticillata]|nr:hypothetical protein BGZ59_003375 [Podila verticillata]